MWLRAMCVPDALNGTQGEPNGLGQWRAQSNGDLTKWLGASEGEHLDHVSVGWGGSSGERVFVAQQSLNTFFGVARLLAPDGWPADAGLVGDVQDKKELVDQTSYRDIFISPDQPWKQFH